MNSIDYIGKFIDVHIDRPLGSKHPKHGFIYPVNYGYVPNTISGDGEELDCYVLGVFEPIKEFRGKCIAIIHRTNDNDGTFTIADVVLLQKWILTKPDATLKNWKAGDLYEDAIINIMDLCLMKEKF